MVNVLTLVPFLDSCVLILPLVSCEFLNDFSLSSHFFYRIPRLKNVNRNAATYHSVTVNDLTVVITEFQPKVKKERKIKGVSKVGSSQTFDEDSSRTSRSPSESGDGITSDENSLPHPNSNGNLPLDTGSGFL